MFVFVQFGYYNFGEFDHYYMPILLLNLHDDWNWHEISLDNNISANISFNQMAYEQT